MRQNSGRTPDDPAEHPGDNPPVAPAASVAPQVPVGGFPDVAKMELDELLEQLIQRARDVQAIQGRLPESYPSVNSFLGVPIQLAQRMLGNINLTDKQGAGEPSHDDEELVTALAAAGAAIENVGLFAESCRRQDWQAAMVALSTALLTGVDPAQALPQIVHHARVTSSAAGASVCTLTDGTGVLRVMATEGVFGDWDGVTALVDGSVYAEALSRRRPVVVVDPATDPRTSARVDAQATSLGPMVAVPMISDVAADGVLFVGRKAGESAFDALDLEMLSTYAAHAALVLQLAGTRRDNEILRMTNERQHIAEELHHRVIQRLFRLGLDLQGVSARVADPQIRDVINLKIDETDAVIRELRDAIFSLNPLDVPADG